MTNNDSLRSLRYTFDLDDLEVIKIFSLVDHLVTRTQISDWLKKDDDPNFESLKGSELASFLNGFIVRNRGKKEDSIPAPEKWMSNNLILKKVKIALDLKSGDIKNILNSAGASISDHELSAFFRKPDHKNFRKCQDQILRAFLKGLQTKYRPSEDK